MDQQYAVDEQPPLTQEEVAKAITMGARQGRAGCIGYTELDDLIQVCWLDTLEKPRKYQRYINAGNFNGLVKEMVRTSGSYAQREKAAVLGYKPEDLFFYSRRILREVIPAILEYQQTGETFEYEYPDRALWLDVSAGLRELSLADQQLITWAFAGDPGREVGANRVAAHLGISQAAAISRTGRVLDKLRGHLGGDNPFERRRIRSSASAQAELQHQWEG
jgi:hypothetical protein